MYVVFDLLADTRPVAARATLAVRRTLLEKFFAQSVDSPGPIRLSPATDDVRQARRWFRSAGGSLDGVMAKRTDLPYQSGNRDGMVKIKPTRTVDCVIGGFRYASGARPWDRCCWACMTPMAC